MRPLLAIAALLALAGCAGDGDSFARQLGRGIGEGFAAGVREGAGGPIDPEALAEALGRGFARGAAEELRPLLGLEAAPSPEPPLPPSAMPTLPPPSSYTH